MKCPVCDDVKMREVIKDEVEIDVCPQCKGVWLDRGELEKLMQGVREVRQDYERMEQQMQQDAPPFASQAPQPSQQPSQQGSGFDTYRSPQQGGQAAAGQGFGASQPYSNPQQGSPVAPVGQGFGSQPYTNPQHGGFGAPPPPPPPGGSGYNQPYGGYGTGQPSNPGYPPNYGQGYGKGHYGYDKYGRPYKKKKTVLDVFGDLFD